MYIGNLIIKNIVLSFFLLLALPCHSLTVSVSEVAGLGINEGSGGVNPPVCFQNGHLCSLGSECCGTYCNSGFCSSTPPSTDHPRIMPFGDSITFGSGSLPITARYGYRDGLQDLLGVGVYDFVGRFTDPDTSTAYDVDHSGRGGDDTRNLLERIDSELATYFPLPNPSGSWIILMIGTNDIKDQEITETQTIDNVQELIETIDDWDSSINILVNTIIPSTDSVYNPNFTAYNAALVTRLETLNNSKANLFYGDMNAKFRTCNGGNYAPPNCMSDKLHPNNFGYTFLERGIYDCMQSSTNQYCNGN